MLRAVELAAVGGGGRREHCIWCHKCGEQRGMVVEKEKEERGAAVGDEMKGSGPNR